MYNYIPYTQYLNTQELKKLNSEFLKAPNAHKHTICCIQNKNLQLFFSI